METAVRLFGRLSETEKIALRGAPTEGRQEYLALTLFNSDLPLVPDTEKILIGAEVKALCDLEFAQKSSASEFGQTWKY